MSNVTKDCLNERQLANYNVNAFYSKIVFPRATPFCTDVYKCALACLSWTHAE